MTNNNRLIPNGFCWCGCGREIGIGRFFAQGHDKVAEAALMAVRYEASVPRLLAEHGFGPDESVTQAAVEAGSWETCPRGCGYVGAPASMRNHEKKPHQNQETTLSILTAYDATELRAKVFPKLWDAYDKLTDSVLRSEVGKWGQVLAVGNSAGGTEYALIGRCWNADRTGWASNWVLLATPETIGGAQGAAVDYAANGSGEEN